MPRSRVAKIGTEPDFRLSRLLPPRTIAKLGSVPIFVLLCAPAMAAIFPEQIGSYQRSAPQTLSVPDRALYEEYGLEATEAADYATPNPAQKRFSAVGWRLHDSTGALALFQFRRPPEAVAAAFAPLAVRTSDGVIFAYGNYVFQFTGAYPDPASLAAFYRQLSKLENSPLPSLTSYLPAQGLAPNSERYILGPVSLARFAPAIPPSVAAFHLGAEAQLGKYQTAKGLLTVALFSYPTPSMARQQALEFQKIPGAMVKRTGPLVVATVQPPDPDAAERILGRINYQASVTVNEKPPVDEIRGFAKMILNMFVLAGIILVICVMGGVGFAGYRILSRKMWQKEDSSAMITLDLGQTTHDKE
jgi:hypothetical protein